MILPPGTDNQHATTEIAPYDNLASAYPSLTSGDIYRYFKDSHFGVVGAVGRQYTPRPGATIIRDAQWGVPHIYGTTDDDVWFASGYASAEDRLSIMDLLRALGRSDTLDLTGSAAGYAADVQTARLFGYSDADLQAQLDRLPRLYGADGRRTLDAIHQFILGVNQYVTQVDAGQLPTPPGYTALGKPPALWYDTDVVAVTAVVASLFGERGGGELANATFLGRLQSRFGTTEGARVYEDFRNRDNRDGPTQAQKAFPYMPYVPGAIDPAATIGGAFTPSSTGQGGTGASNSAAAQPTPTELAQLSRASAIDWTALDLKTPLGEIDIRPRGMSNAFLVSGSRSADGHPMLLAGPQAGYWSPEILIELDMHGPTINTRGAAFPGISMFIELGRGPDFAYSATSGGSDNIDTRVEKLCDPSGAAPTVRSYNYLFNGRCLPMERHAIIEPLGSPFPNIEAERTVHGPVIARGTVGGAPVALTRQRTSYLEEVDSAVAFMRLAQARVTSAQDFVDTMGTVNFGANWLYIDDRDIAYVHTGTYPRRLVSVNPDMAAWGTGQYEWQGLMSPDQNPHEINPARGFLTSWNNRPAPAWNAADNNYGWSSLYRASMIDRALQSGGTAMTPVSLVQAMERVGLTDMRGQTDLPLLLRVLDASPAPSAREAKEEAILKDWLKRGPLRLDDGRGTAVAIMDAWWSALVPAIYNPVIGDVTTVPLGIDNAPGAGGSAYQDGFYGQVWTDLSMLTGQGINSPTHRTYCGGTTTAPGTLQTCSAVLWAALRSAGDSLAQSSGSSDPGAWDYSAQAERIRFLPGVALSMGWVNRPTFQQLEEFTGHRPRGGSDRGQSGASARPGLPLTSTAPWPLLLMAIALLLGLVAAGRRLRRGASRRPRPSRSDPGARSGGRIPCARTSPGREAFPRSCGAPARLRLRCGPGRYTPRSVPVRPRARGTPVAPPAPESRPSLAAASPNRSGPPGSRPGLPRWHRLLLPPGSRLAPPAR
jgi:acyl-homoserine lactone acylase PvdQ